MKRSGCVSGLIRAFAISACLISVSVFAAPKGVSFSGPTASVAAYDYAEIGLHVASPDARNPFTANVSRCPMWMCRSVEAP